MNTVNTPVAQTLFHVGNGSEYNEDYWIAQHLWNDVFGGGRTGERFYVDVGAMRPDQCSNTAFLRAQGWKGLAIDGHGGCERHWTGVPGAKFVHAVISTVPCEVGFICREPGHEAESRVGSWNDVTSPLAQLRPAHGTTLGAVLAREGVGVIDFLSLDIEGLEHGALVSMDLEKHRPRIIVAEYATLQPNGRVVKDYAVLEYLLATGHYTVVHQTVANLIYLRR